VSFDQVSRPPRAGGCRHYHAPSYIFCRESLRKYTGRRATDFTAGGCQVRHGFAEGILCQQFGFACVGVLRHGTHITTKDCRSEGMVSEITGGRSPGRHCHSALSLAAIDYHSRGIYTVILLSLLSFLSK
jgi:hypothetical protein